jgi:nucleoside diphosphate kinase
MKREVAHAMLKPDTLESGLEDVVIKELLGGGCEIIVSKKFILDMDQISAIYSTFSNKIAKPVVFNYFTSRLTRHLALIGSEGLHDRLDVIKGQTGSGQGIRGKYYTRYTRLSESELAEWLAGTLANAEDIDLEMFGKDILHVADTPSDSIRGLRAVLDPDQLQLLRKNGVDI